MQPLVKTPFSNFDIKTFSIREKQIESIRRLLCLHSQREGDDSSSQEIWKVLIYDQFGRDVIAPLLNVQELRKLGITLHMMIESHREPIPDVPAIYFVFPNESNIKQICKDAKENLYSELYLSFASSIPYPLLDTLSRLAIEFDIVSKITRIYDQYCNFFSLEDSLFHLGHHHSYIDFHDPTMSEEKAQQNIQHTVDVLFAVMVTLNTIPIIRCPKGDSAELVATQLDAKIRQHLSSENHLFENSGWNRPVLIILDRNIDLSVMISHGWSYQALIHDLLNYRANRVQIEVENENDSPQTPQQIGLNTKYPNSTSKMIKTYNLDYNEPWWLEHASLPFPTVATHIQTELNRLNQKVMSHEKQNAMSDNEDGQNEESILLKTRKMSEFVSTIPAMEARIRVLSMHMEIATCVLKKIQAHHHDQYFSLEETIMTIPALPHSFEVMTKIRSDLGTPEDKFRLLLIYFMSKINQLDNAELAEFKQELTQQGISLAPLNYLEKIHAFNESWSLSNQRSLPQQKPLKDDWLKTFGNMLSSGVQYLLPANKDFHVTRILDSIMELKETNGVNNFLYLDPKFPTGSAPKKTSSFKEAIVFMIGGGNYIEMHNIMEYVRRSCQGQNLGMPKKVIYGTTEIISPGEFLDQMALLDSKEEEQRRHH